MYTIGQFSRIGMISPKTLRFYDEIGLIKPAQVDQWNSYRYYSAEQVADILFINELRGCGFSLEAIKQLIREKDSESLQKAMIRRRSELDGELQHIFEVRKRIDQKITVLTKGGNFMDVINNYHIELKQREPQVIYGIRKQIGMDKFGTLIEELLVGLTETGLKPIGPTMVFYHECEFNPENADIEVSVPVGESTSENKELREIPGGLNITTTYTGPYREIGKAYAAIMQWMNEHEYKVTGPSCEIHLVNPGNCDDEAKYVTEIWFPVSK